MKLLVIGNDRKIFEDGSAVSLRQIKYSAELERLDIIVYARQALGLGTKILSSKVTVYPTNSRTRFFYFLDAFFLGKNLPKPDMVSAQDPFESGLAGYFIARYWSVPLHLQLHTDFLSPYFWRDSLLNKARFILGKFLIRRADSLRVVLKRTKDEIVVSGLMSAEKITVQPIVVDIERMKNFPVKTDLHKKYPQFDFIILMASRITREKNIELAIEAMRETIKKYPKTGLVIVGDGPEKDKLKLLTTNYSLLANVIFEEWTNDLPSFYKTADIFLLTSNYEGYGMTIVEALAAGLPIVMTNVGCAGDVMVDGRDGLVVPVGDFDALIVAIEKFVE